MKDSSLLQCAAFHGLTGIVEWLLLDVAQGKEAVAALCAASQRGHRATVKLLSAKYIAAGIHDKDVGIALIAASGGGHKQSIQLLFGIGVLQHTDSTLCIADTSDRPVLFYSTYRRFTLR